MPHKNLEEYKAYQKEYQRIHREEINTKIRKKYAINLTFREKKRKCKPSIETRLKSDRTAGRRWRISKKYGLTVEECDLKLLQQNNLCAICKRPETIIDSRTGTVRRLAIDHDHTTNQFRGMLCINCNQALGKFQDDISLLESAIEYLKKSRNL